MSDGLNFGPGIDNFVASVAELADTFTDTAEKHLKKTGNKLKRTVKAATPDSGYSHRKKLSKSWKGKIQGLSGTELQYQLRNTAPHYHLVNRGHVIKSKNGKVTGFVQGKHFFETAVNEYDSSGDFAAELNKFIDDCKTKLGG